MVPRAEPNLTPAQLADLTALADGSIDPRRREQVEAWVRAAPEQLDLYRRQVIVVDAVRRVSATDRAPERLRRQIESRRWAAERSGHRLGLGFRSRLGFGAVLATAAAAAIAAVTLALPSGTPGSPSIAQAESLALRGPTGPAPGLDPRDPRTMLAGAVQDIYFPNWSTKFGWRAVGARRDTLGGRPAITVYYAARGGLLAYTILGSPALAQPSAPLRVLNGIDLRTLRLHGRTVVTWRRSGHTCVISARGVPESVLQRLAAWR
jgi:hypothetical protein